MCSSRTLLALRHIYVTASLHCMSQRLAATSILYASYPAVACLHAGLHTCLWTCLHTCLCTCLHAGAAPTRAWSRCPMAGHEGQMPAAQGCGARLCATRPSPHGAADPFNPFPKHLGKQPTAKAEGSGPVLGQQSKAISIRHVGQIPLLHPDAHPRCSPSACSKMCVKKSALWWSTQTSIASTRRSTRRHCMSQRGREISQA